MNQKQDGILRYAYNLFAFPKGYFEEHTAEELKITEDERLQLIKMQAEDEHDDSKIQKEEDALKEFE
jgi:hypothetical protein